MSKTRYVEDTPRTVALAVLGWSLVVAVAAATGALARFSPQELAALAAFASGFAYAAYRLDETVRGYVLSIRARRLRNAAIALDALLVASALRLAMFSDSRWEDFASAPLAFAALVLAPLALVIHAAQLEALRARLRGAPAAIRSAAAKGPAASSAAT
jgi:hypothetical protein